MMRSFSSLLVDALSLVRPKPYGEGGSARLLVALVLCCAAMSARAQEEEASAPRSGQAVEALPGEQQIELSVPPGGAPAEPAAEEPAPLPPGTRDPLWPVGYVPPSERKVDAQTTAAGPAVVVEKLEPPQWDLALKTLAIKGVMKSGAGYMAVINGQVTSENDTISAVFKSRTYSWRIAKIGKEGVRFERLELAQ
jgi:hypothetical protein